MVGTRVLIVRTTPGGGEARRLKGIAEARRRVLHMIGAEKEALTERKIPRGVSG